MVLSKPICRLHVLMGMYHAHVYLLLVSRILTCISAIESKTHGNVLWVPLDHGATRIGYSYSADIAAKYPDGVTEEVAVQEAIECMKPFNLRFKEVHWWTL